MIWFLIRSSWTLVSGQLWSVKSPCLWALVWPYCSCFIPSSLSVVVKGVKFGCLFMKLKFQFTKRNAGFDFILFSLYLDLVKNVSGSDWLRKGKIQSWGWNSSGKAKSKTGGETPLKANIDDRYSLGYQNWNGFLVLFLFGKKTGFFWKKKKTSRTRH